MKGAKRWSRISASANTDAEYKMLLGEPDVAYSFICMDTPYFDTKRRHSSLQSVNDSHTQELLGKPASEHPQYPWIVSQAGWAKYVAQFTFARLRNPDVFQMYTFNHHIRYGILEMVQNLLLDFAEAKDSWQQQWAVVEATVLWLLDDESADINGVYYDDAVDTYRLTGRMVLAMLARLDREDLIDDAKSLGTVLGMCIKLGQIARREGVLGKDEKRVRGAFYYVPDHLCDYIHAYSKRYAVAPIGPSDIKECIKNCRNVDLPASHLNKNDPWGFTAGLRRYRSEHSHGMAAVYCKRPGIGGDTFDITTWKSEDRAAKSFSGKDPLDENDIKCIKEGMVWTFYGSPDSSDSDEDR